MSDLQNRVKIEVAADASGANKVLADLTKKGKETGDKFGKNLNQAQERWLKVAEDGLRKYGGTVGAVFADILQQYDKVKKAMDASKGMGAIGKAGIGAGIVGGAVAGALALTKVLSDAAAHTKEVQKTIVEYQTLKKIVDSMSDPIQRAAYLTKTLGANASDKYAEIAKKGKEAMWEMANTPVWTTLTLQADEFWTKYGIRVKTAAKEGFAMFSNLLAKITTLGTGSITVEDITISFLRLKAKISEETNKALLEMKKAEKEKNDALQKQIDLVNATRDPSKMERYLKQQQKALFLEWQKTGALADQLAYLKAIKELEDFRAKGKEDERRKASEEVDRLTAKDPNTGRNPLTGVTPYDRSKMTDEEILQAESNRLRDSALSPSERALMGAGVNLMTGEAMSPEERAKTLGNKSTRDLYERSKKIGEMKSFKRQLDPANRYEANKKNMERASLLEQMAKAFVENGNAHPVKPLNGK